MAKRRAATAASNPIRVQIPIVIADKTLLPSQSVSGRASQATIRSTQRGDRLLTVSAGITAASRLATTNDSNRDRKSTRLNSSHVSISYAVFCLKKKNNLQLYSTPRSPDPLH